MDNRLITEVHISNVKVGDTVIHNDVEMTVCRNNIKRDEFMGTTLFGDSYRLGTIPVKKVDFICHT
jgi:hypothetical protein